MTESELNSHTHELLRHKTGMLLTLYGFFIRYEIPGKGTRSNKKQQYKQQHISIRQYNSQYNIINLSQQMHKTNLWPVCMFASTMKSVLMKRHYTSEGILPPISSELQFKSNLNKWRHYLVPLSLLYRL